MARPIVINWNIPDNVSVCAAQTTIAGTPLNFTSTEYITDIFTGVTTPYFTMPFGNVRKVRLSSAADFSAVDFTIVGEDEAGFPLNEVLTGPGAGLTVDSVNAYYKLISITPDTLVPSNISAGLGNGYTVWNTLDLWNKIFSVSLSYTNLSAGVFSVTPQFTQTELYTFQDGLMVFKPNTAIQPFVLPVADFLTDPTPLAIPVVSAASININTFPMVALNTLVGDTTAVSFTQTIIQIGGKY